MKRGACVAFALLSLGAVLFGPRGEAGTSEASCGKIHPSWTSPVTDLASDHITVTIIEGASAETVAERHGSTVLDELTLGELRQYGFTVPAGRDVLSFVHEVGCDVDVRDAEPDAILRWLNTSTGWHGESRIIHPHDERLDGVIENHGRVAGRTK